MTIAVNQFGQKELQIAIDINKTVIFVNQPPIEHEAFSDDVGMKVSLGCVIGVVNLLVLFWLWGKKRTLVDHMMLLDCVSNIGVLTVGLTVINKFYNLSSRSK